jgi:hypothetical protein
MSDLSNTPWGHYESGYGRKESKLAAGRSGRRPLYSLSFCCRIALYNIPIVMRGPRERWDCLSQSVRCHSCFTPFAEHPSSVRQSPGREVGESWWHAVTQADLLWAVFDRRQTAADRLYKPRRPCSNFFSGLPSYPSHHHQHYLACYRAILLIITNGAHPHHHALQQHLHLLQTSTAS